MRPLYLQNPPNPSVTHALRALFHYLCQLGLLQAKPQIVSISLNATLITNLFERIIRPIVFHIIRKIVLISNHTHKKVASLQTQLKNSTLNYHVIFSKSNQISHARYKNYFNISSTKQISKSNYKIFYLHKKKIISIELQIFEAVLGNFSLQNFNLKIKLYKANIRSASCKLVLK